MSTEPPLYIAGLRMKTGELAAVSRLAGDLKRHFWPHFIVPPRAERDYATQGVLVTAEGVPDIGRALSRYWPDMPVLVNMEYIFGEFGEDKCRLWLPKAFERAREARGIAIPVAAVADMTGSRAQAFKDAIGDGIPIKLAVRISFEQAADPAAMDRLKVALDSLRLAPSDCAVLADFSQNADFSQPSSVAGVLESTFDLIERVGNWHTITFQGSSYPETNPAEPGCEKVVPRNEWHAWKEAVDFGPHTSGRLVFGDFAADSSKMSFGKSRRKPICHYRYTTPNDWLVVRGDKGGSNEVVMREVCQRIVDSGDFAGRAFSVADEYIFQTSKGLAGPGSPTTWRELNTIHHITRVVRDIGLVRGLSFREVKLPTDGGDRQLGLFADTE